LGFGGVLDSSSSSSSSSTTTFFLEGLAFGSEEISISISSSNSIYLLRWRTWIMVF